MRVLFLPFAVALFLRPRTEALVYFVTSFVVGSYAGLGAGVGPNAWFDFFAAAAIVTGLAAAAAAERKGFRRGIAAYGVLALLLFPFFAHFNKATFAEALAFGQLRDREKVYRQDVELLRSIPGPALFEDPLLGFDAGKAFVFDPSSPRRSCITG